MAKHGPAKSDLKFRLWASLFGLAFTGGAIAYRGWPTTIGGWEAIGLALLFFAASLVWNARKLFLGDHGD